MSQTYCSFHVQTFRQYMRINICLLLILDEMPISASSTLMHTHYIRENIIILSRKLVKQEFQTSSSSLPINRFLFPFHNNNMSKQLLAKFKNILIFFLVSLITNFIIFIFPGLLGYNLRNSRVFDRP